MEAAAIYNTIHFIESNYNKVITIKELEAVSHYSYRNIQRIFKYACGETIGAYQKRLKIERAYKLLLYTTEPLTSIALEVGFENSASFSKAFSQAYSISPSEARKNKSILFEKNKITPAIIDAWIEPEIVYETETKIYYQSTKTHYANENIEELWQKITGLSFPASDINYYGIIADQPIITDKLKCRYDACASIQPVNGTLPSKKILGGRYAKFLHHGSYNTIEQTYYKIYAGWVLSTKLEFSPSPIIEQYIKNPGNTANELDYVTAILIPVN